jgi:hypothetical protein
MSVFRWVTGVAGTVAAGVNPVGTLLVITVVILLLAGVVAVLGWLYTRLAPSDRRDLVELVRAVRGRPPDSS